MSGTPWVFSQVPPEQWALRILVLAVIVGFLSVAIRLGWNYVSSSQQMSKRSRTITMRALVSAERTLTDQAAERLAALGEALDATEMRPRDDARHWQRALDAYAEAARLHDTDSPGPADARILELCDEGFEALNAATRRTKRRRRS